MSNQQHAIAKMLAGLFNGSMSMISLRRAAVALTCLLWTTLTGERAAWATISCVRPTPDQIVEMTRPGSEYDSNGFRPNGVVFLPFNHASRQRQWMGASWGGPVSGVLMVIDCSGKYLAAKPIGAVYRLRRGPKLAIGETAEVIFADGSATGERWTSVGFVRFNGTAIEVLWEHRASDDVAFPELGGDYMDTFRWRVSEDGTAIRVTGLRKVGSVKDPDYGWPPRTTHRLPTESFCWSPATAVYQPCR